jgi:hypothetical protein
MEQSRVVHKYVLDWNLDEQTLTLPAGAKPLALRIQRDMPVLYMQHSTLNKPREKTFIFVFTGQEFEGMDYIYIGTVERLNGLVYHLFEVIKHD